MKKIFHISLSILLSAIILVSGSGLIIGKMVCLKSGSEMVSARELKDCCDDGSGKIRFEGKCCDINNIVFQQNHFVVSSNYSLKSPAAIQLFIPAENFQTVLLNSISSLQPCFSADPPLLDRNSSSFLPFSGVFRI